MRAEEERKGAYTYLCVSAQLRSHSIKKKEKVGRKGRTGLGKRQRERVRQEIKSK